MRIHTSVSDKHLAVQFTEHIPVRSVVLPTGGIVRGKIPSYKTGRMIAYESLLEKDAILLFEFSSGVIGIREQPIKITYELEGKLRRYTPDFEIDLESGKTLLIEVKPASKLAKSENKEKFKRITQVMAEKGHDFRILTDEIIRRPLLLSNLSRLHPFCFESLDKEILRRVQLAYRMSSEIPFTELNNITSSLSQTYALIAQGFVWFDLEKHLLADTLLKNKETNHAKFLF